MIHTFGFSICRSGLNSSRGPCLWLWKICWLLNVVTHCVMHAFALVLIDLSCGDSIMGIMFISNVRCLRHWMSWRGALSFGWRRCCRVGNDELWFKDAIERETVELILWNLMAKHQRQLKMWLTLHPTYSSLGWCSPPQLVVEQFFSIHALWIGVGPSCLAGLHS